MLAQSIDREVGKSTAEMKGDWKPLVFIMTDGMPTDSWQMDWLSLKVEDQASSWHKPQVVQPIQPF